MEYFTALNEAKASTGADFKKHRRQWNCRRRSESKNVPVNVVRSSFGFKQRDKY